MTDTDMLFMIEKEIIGLVCHTINRYTKVNNRYMKDYDKDKESSYLKYLNVNNSYRWAISNGSKILFDLMKIS